MVSDPTKDTYLLNPLASEYYHRLSLVYLKILNYNKLSFMFIYIYNLNNQSFILIYYYL